MKRTITRPQRIAGLALLVTVFLLSCRKDHSGNNSLPQEKMVITFNKHAGDSMKYDNKGRVTEQWVEASFHTYYEYPSAAQVIVKSVDVPTNSITSMFTVTLDKGRVIQLTGTHYNANGTIAKNFTSQFEYNAGGYLTKITNDNGNNIDVEFVYTGELVTAINRGYDHAIVEYEMTKQLPVFVPNLVYGLSYDNFFNISGLFYNGMMGKTGLYAVKKLSKPNIWQAPVDFTNTYGKNNELLKTKLTLWEQMYMSLEMDLRYKNILIDKPNN